MRRNFDPVNKSDLKKLTIKRHPCWENRNTFPYFPCDCWLYSLTLVLHWSQGIIRLHFGATKENVLLSCQQAWKHLSSKVCEILEELRAVQVCVRVGVFEQAHTYVVCNWRLGWSHIVKLGCRANKSIEKQLQAMCLCAEGLQLALLLKVTPQKYQMHQIHF